PQFDPVRTAILERPPLEAIDALKAPHDWVETTGNETTSQEFRVHAEGRGLLVVSEVFYPGWQAWVNGQPARIYRVDGVLRGTFVPNGDSIVRFEYRPVSVRIGFAMTLAATTATVVLGFFARSKRAPPGNLQGRA